MAHGPSNYDDGWVSGWANISAYLGVSIRTSKRFVYELKMPIVQGVGRPRAWKVELAKWLIIVGKRVRSDASWHQRGTNLTHIRKK